MRHERILHGHRIGKLGAKLDDELVRGVLQHKGFIDQLSAKSRRGVVFYQEACRYWLKASHRPPRFIKNGVRMEPPHGRKLLLQSENAAAFVAAILNSSLFYWWYSAFSDCEHVNDALVRTFPIPEAWSAVEWMDLTNRLVDHLEAGAKPKTINTKQGHVIEYDEISATPSKFIMDEIDIELARIYGLSREAADYVVNYDIKYRTIGQDEEAPA